MKQNFEPKNSLIVCYSYSGNTWQVAEEIKRQTGAPLCEIYPKQPYPMLFETILAQVRDEIEDDFLPSIFPIMENVEDYDTIFVGTPNWCGTMAPPIRTFLECNDLDGKRLLPFYTHCGGGTGNVERDIRRTCSNSVVGDGISIVNDGGSSLKEKIASWLEICY